MQTVKNDWLNDLLANHDYHVSGHPTFAEKLGISGEATLRFARLRENIIYFLAIKPVKKKSVYQQEYLDAFRAGKINLFINKFPHLIQLFYAEELSVFNLFFPSKGYFKEVSFDRMVDFVSHVNEDFRRAAGASKAINVSMNDAFQFWTRNFLSAYAVVNDIDAFTLAGDQPLFLELKRLSTQSIIEWQPYLDDRANFASLNIIAKQQNGEAITLAYEPKNEAALAYHRYVTPTRADYITGKSSIIQPVVRAADLLAIDLRAAPSYTSTRWRTKPAYLK